MKFSKNICIIGARRSAIGKFMGTLAGQDPVEISAQVIRGGFDPQYMGLGPYYAVSSLLEETGIDFKNIECFELNEAFAAQALGSVKLLAGKYGVTEEDILRITNPYGSGLGLGHPLGATGARIIVTLAHYMKNTSKKRGAASLCIGGGMGAAVLLTR